MMDSPKKCQSEPICKQKKRSEEKSSRDKLSLKLRLLRTQYALKRKKLTAKNGAKFHDQMTGTEASELADVKLRDGENHQQPITSTSDDTPLSPVCSPQMTANECENHLQTLASTSDYVPSSPVYSPPTSHASTSPSASPVPCSSGMKF
uniref:BZIP domain-containing protein n=1 Tax=Globodera pallida TaxID=36090 RepID=A0A183C0C3_GLOPA